MPRKSKKVSLDLPKPQLIYSPLIRDGIPDLKYDSRSWNDYWDEIWDYCTNGYKPKGHEGITGKYFFYLNLWKISRLAFSFDDAPVDEKIISFPLYRKFDHALSEHFRDSRIDKKNVIIGKFRRAGITDFCVATEIAHEMLFREKNQVAMAVPYDEVFSLTFPKLYTGLQSLPKEMYQGVIADNDKEMQIGYTYTDEMGNPKEGGSQSHLFKKVFSRAGKMKGSWVRTLFIDEVGEFNKTNTTLRQAYAESRDIVLEGGNPIGMIILAGTSDKINNASDDYEYLFYNGESSALNLRPFFIPDTKWHYDETKKLYYFDFATGESLEKEANDDIEKILKSYENLPDKSDMWKYVQNHPRCPEDMFIATTDNNMNIARVNERIRYVLGDPKGKDMVIAHRLEEEKDERGEKTGQVVARPDPQGRFHILEHPVNHLYRNADIGGVDDYMKDKAETSASKGSIVIYRRFVDAGVPCKIPVMVYWHRPPTLREFWADCILAARYYRCQLAFEMNTSGANVSPQYLYFKEQKAVHMLKQYPIILGKPMRVNEAFGYPVKEEQMGTIRMKLASFIESPEFNNVFDLRLLRQITEFGKKNTDIISALGICFLYENDLIRQVVNRIWTPEELKMQQEEEGNMTPHNRFSFSSDGAKPQPNWAISSKKPLFGWQADLRRTNTGEQNEDSLFKPGDQYPYGT